MKKYKEIQCSWGIIFYKDIALNQKYLAEENVLLPEKRNLERELLQYFMSSQTRN